jgi:hypothetical protein
VLVNCALLGSYFQFVRTDAQNHWMFPSRLAQEADALAGIGGWGWFKPVAPSLDGNLAELIANTKGDEALNKYKALRNQIPYVFFPLQTWLYIAGIFFGFDVAARALQAESGADPPRSLAALLRDALRHARILLARRSLRQS